MEPNLTRNEALIEDGHAYGEADARTDLARLHSVYRDTLTALTASAIKHRVMLSKDELEVAMEGVGEALANEADTVLEHLPNESYTPADAKNLIDKAHTSLVDAFRVTAIDWAGAFEKMFRPQPTRGSAPTNPQTLITKGEL